MIEHAIDKRTVVIATEHKRHDLLVKKIKLHLDGYTVVRAKSPDDITIELLDKINPLYIFFPHWSHIIPSKVYKKYECVIFHMTDLPFGRGGTPLQNLIVRGYKETMLSAFRCVQEIDSGPIYKKLPLSLNGNAEDILQRTSILMEKVIIEILLKNLQPIPQEGQATLFARRNKHDGDISEISSLEKVYDYIRMLDADGYPPAFLVSKNLLFEFTDAVLENNEIIARVKIRNQ
jgi:methionyl-tRNA formyltransferase